MRKILEDIEFYSEDSDSLIFGSRSINEYVKVKCSNIDIIKNIILLFDGAHSEMQIEEYCAENHVKINLEKLITEIDRKCLFEDSNAQGPSKEEIKMLGIKVFDKQFADRQITSGSKVASYIIACINISIVLSMIYLIFRFDLIKEIFSKNLLMYKDSYINGMLVTFGMSLIVLVIHECGHILFACRYHLQIERFGLYLYIGIMPKWFFKFRGIQVAPRKQRELVFLGGVYFNFFLIILACILSSFLDVDLVRTFILSNFLMIINCLLPFSLTDGYFLFSNLLHIENLRNAMFRSIFQFLKLKINKKNIGVFIYFIINVCIYSYKIILYYLWLFRSLNEITIYTPIIIGLCTCIHLCVLLKAITKNVKAYV